MSQVTLDQMDRLVVSKEARDPDYLKQLFVSSPHFATYQHVANRMRSVYHNLYIRYRHYERVKTLLELAKTSHNMLDVGCGFGDLSLELANKSVTVVALDLSKECLNIAKRRSHELNLGTSWGAVRGDAHSLPFRENCFDMAFSNQVVEHVAEPAKILSEQLRVSRRAAVMMCRNTRPLPGVRLIYYLMDRTIEEIPEIGKCDKTFYINHAMLPVNSRLSIIIAGAVSKVPYLNKALAGNIAKVFRKRS